MKQIMVGQPKAAQSEPGVEDSASDPPNSNDLQKSANRTFGDRIGSFDARVQSARLHEAFVAPEPLTPGSEPRTCKTADRKASTTGECTSVSIGGVNALNCMSPTKTGSARAC